MTFCNVLSARGPILALSAAVALSGCHSADPYPNVYVLGIAPPVRPADESQLGQPVIEVKLAQLPDYLDSTDIITHRAGGRVTASETGRWGERLSVGVTRAVALSLAAQLPGLAVTTLPPLAAPWRQVRIEIDSFSARPDGECVVSAEWSIRAGDNGRLLEKQRTALVVAVAGSGDAAVVAAMGSEVNTLADRIALALREPPPGALAGSQRGLPPVWHLPLHRSVSAISWPAPPMRGENQ